MELLNYKDETPNQKTTLSIEVIHDDIFILLEDNEQQGKAIAYLLTNEQAYEVSKALKSVSQNKIRNENKKLLGDKLERDIFYNSNNWDDYCHKIKACLPHDNIDPLFCEKVEKLMITNKLD